ncbi:MAG: tetratricopeptide repeat protein [Leptotrichiaceae bacterium]|jgi:tetratricopeptide (TPR) repeat protein|nr:tetratricopeptide repeat protein [Leptotrichiaceae bacterium]MBP6168536.1 tetratricopeptide repeat protein [Leptotrichiaceae bacterium]MBP7026919.1 tetratricopeptide repeat protein [Leptotrichiaceae bacterium]MBP8637491.1 tetratricopeptide repeat protein [Leptotrichiaceae bacterium]MBP9876628.1 tetratricopeptide repeat protein [Leptotrichiaceae bacterium]
MLKTLLFREIRYNDNIEDELAKNEEDLKNDSNNIELLQNIAAIYHALRKNVKAIEIYDKIVNLRPRDHEMKAFLGYLYYENEELEEAEKHLNESLNLNPMEPFVLFLLGNIYSRRGDVVKAIDNYEFAIFLDFDIYTAHIDFARKYEHMGRHKRALEEYRAAYDIDSRDDALLDKMEYLEKKAECKNTGKCKCE